jgi:predicted glycosyltransferase
MEGRVTAFSFDPRLERLLSEAAGVIAMGGYNTFCEILSFDKPGLIVPRTEPRLEQFIRASRAAELGLVSMLRNDGVRAPADMATAICQLGQQGRPSDHIVPGLLDGLDSVNILARRLIDRPRPARGLTTALRVGEA